MNRTVRKLSLLLILALLLSACGKKPEPTAAPTDAPTKPVITEPAPTETTAETAPETQPANLNHELSSLYTYTTRDVTLEFDGESAFIMKSPESQLSGTYLWDGKNLTLTDESGAFVSGTIDQTGSIYLQGGEGVFVPGTAVNHDGVLLGQWQYYGSNLSVSLYEGGTFIISLDGETQRCRYEEADDSFLLFIDGQLADRFSFTDDGRMEFSLYPGRWLLPAEHVPDCVSERYELEANWWLDDDAVLLENGGRWRLGVEAGLMPSLWEAPLVSDDTNDDGTRTIQFQVVASLPEDTTPFDSDMIYSLLTTFYDYDTGLILLRDFTYLDSTSDIGFEHPQGHVDLSVTAEIEKFPHSIAQEYGMHNLRIYHISVTMPEWYHGLMYAAMAIDPDAAIGDLPFNYMQEDELLPYAAQSLRLNLD